MTAQDVAVIPVVEPWLSLAVPPAWIIHLRFLDLTVTTSLQSDQHFFAAHWQCHWCLLYTTYYAIYYDMMMIMMTIYPMVYLVQGDHLQLPFFISF